MKYYLIILLIIALATIVWPINKICLSNKGRSEYLSMVIAFVAGIAALVFAVLSKGYFMDLNAFALGSLTGITYAISSCVLLKCVKIGPMGLSVTFNNLGLLWPVVTGIVFFPAISGVSIIKITGVVIIVIAMLLLSKEDTETFDGKINKIWFKLIVLAWAFTGISGIAQLLFSIYGANNLMVYAFYTYVIAFISLLLYNAFYHSLRPLKEEIVGGTLNGLVYFACFSLTNYILVYLSPTIVFFASTLLPLILVLIIGCVGFKETLNKFVKIGITLALFGFIFIQL